MMKSSSTVLEIQSAKNNKERKTHSKVQTTKCKKKTRSDTK